MCDFIDRGTVPEGVRNGGILCSGHRMRLTGKRSMRSRFCCAVPRTVGLCNLDRSRVCGHVGGCTVRGIGVNGCVGVSGQSLRGTVNGPGIV